MGKEIMGEAEGKRGRRESERVMTNNGGGEIGRQRESERKK